MITIANIMSNSSDAFVLYVRYTEEYASSVAFTIGNHVTIYLVFLYIYQQRSKMSSKSLANCCLEAYILCPLYWRR